MQAAPPRSRQGIPVQAQRGNYWTAWHTTAANDRSYPKEGSPGQRQFWKFKVPSHWHDCYKCKKDTVKAQNGSSNLWSDFLWEVLRQLNMTPWNCNGFIDKLKLVSKEAHSQLVRPQQVEREQSTHPHPEAPDVFPLERQITFFTFTNQFSISKRGNTNLPVRELLWGQNLLTAATVHERDLNRPIYSTLSTKNTFHYLGWVRTSPMALTMLPSTNIPMGIPLRFGQLLMLWPEGPVFTTL